MIDRTAQRAATILVSTVLSLLILLYGMRASRGSSNETPTAADKTKTQHATPVAVTPTVITTAKYHRETTGGSTRIYIDYHLRVLVKEWPKAPRASGDTPLLSPIANTSAHPILYDDGRHLRPKVVLEVDSVSVTEKEKEEKEPPLLPLVMPHNTIAKTLSTLPSGTAIPMLSYPLLLTLYSRAAAPVS